jgi:hypothetical protein
MGGGDSQRKDDPEETVRLLKNQIVDLRRWFERERWKIEPQARSFSPRDPAPTDAGPPGEESSGLQIRRRGQAAESAEGPAAPGS